MKGKSAVLFLVSAITLALAVHYGSQGMDKINHYYLNETIPSASTNAYVGGDAYNYIINGTYFSGYSALCGGLLAASGASFSAGMVILAMEDLSARKDEQDKPVVTDDELPSL